MAASSKVPLLLTHAAFVVQGSAVTPMSGTDGLLSPAREHVFDALAAFDAGQLQGAQHAFDLSVWADVKNDRGNQPHAAQLFVACSIEHLAQAPEPTSNWSSTQLYSLLPSTSCHDNLC